MLEIRIEEHSDLIVLLLLLVMINNDLHTKETNMKVVSSKGEKNFLVKPLEKILKPWKLREKYH